MITLTSPREGNFRLKINREGIFLYLILFAIGLAAYNTGNNLLFLIVSVIAAIYGLHSILNLLSRDRNHVVRILPKTIYAGDPVSITLRATNLKKFFSTFSILLRDEFKGLENSGRVHFVRIKPGQTEEQRYKAVFNRRGVYQLNRIWLDCRFPFGFSQHSIGYSQPDEIIVYPRLLPLSQIQNFRKGRHGEEEHQEKGFGFSLYNLRQYQEGESSRFIHWKTSAKLNQLMVKEFENEEQRQITIVFQNTGDPSILMDEQFEEGVSKIASLAVWYLQNGWQVELITLSGAFPYGNGSVHLRRLLHHLALITPVSLTAAEAERRLFQKLHPEGRIIWINRMGSEDSSLSSSDREKEVKV